MLLLKQQQKVNRRKKTIWRKHRNGNTKAQLWVVIRTGRGLLGLTPRILKTVLFTPVLDLGDLYWSSIFCASEGTHSENEITCFIKTYHEFKSSLFIYLFIYFLSGLMNSTVPQFLKHVTYLGLDDNRHQNNVTERNPWGKGFIFLWF